MKNLLLLIMAFVALNGHSQNTELSATLSYPLPVGDNVISSLTGVVDLGMQARLITLGPIALGISANVNYLTSSNEVGSVAFKENALFIQPRFFGELRLQGLQKLRPGIGLGYSIANYKSKVEADGGQDISDNYGGLNLNLGVSYFISDSWFLQLQYDYIKLNRDDILVDAGFFNNVNLLKLGLGYQF